MGNWSRFFDFGKAVNGEEIAITQNGNTDGLRVEVGSATRDMRWIEVPSMLRTREWTHYALVLGRTKTLFYLNGVQVGATEPADLPSIARDARAAVGRNLWVGTQGFAPNDLPDFAGQMDQVRIWKVPRTEAQIREDMFRHLSGTEPGLVGLWNFRNVTNGIVEDLSGGHHDGRLIGNARVVGAELPVAQTTRTERVLDLDGNDSAVQLPPNIFNSLSNATIEAWVKFHDFSGSRFYSYGGFLQDLGFGRRFPPFTGKDLDIFVALGGGQVDEVVVRGIIQTDPWYHVAAVLGPGGMQLLVNGVLTATNSSAASFSSLPSGDLNFVGRMNGGQEGAPGVVFNGQVADFRVWQTRRTPAEIRENMFRHLSGNEPGLAGLWDFQNVSNGLVKDLSPGHHDGKLLGNARVVSSQMPAPDLLAEPSVIFGTVKDEAGKPVANATLQLWHGQEAAASVQSGPEGSYSMVTSTGTRSSTSKRAPATWARGSWGFSAHAANAKK